MEFGWSEAEEEYRQELRAFVDRDLVEYPRNTRPSELATRESVDDSLAFTGRLAERGWLVPHWPTEYGGADYSPWRHIIMGEEMWIRGELRGPQYMSVNWIGPAIMQYGTPEQQAYHLPRIRAGNVIWCQGFSEPEAGSDLASLTTRAVRDGDDYIVNGEKIWTSYANTADFCILLVRTDPESDRHHGITVLLAPTDVPGFEVVELDSVLGGNQLHAVVFRDMRVPVSCRLGAENEGWPLILEALGKERFDTARYARAANNLDGFVRDSIAAGGFTHQGTQERAALARARCDAARLLSYRVVDALNKNLDPGSHTNVARVALVDADRAVGDVGFDLVGTDGLVTGSLADEQFRQGLPAGVGAGTLEIQLNLISRAILGSSRS